MLVGMSFWAYLLLLSIGILWMLIRLFQPSKAKLGNMLKMGLFLAAFDWVFETTGLVFGYWQSHGSILLLGPAVPAEVFLICTCAGAALNLLAPMLSRKFEWETAVPLALLVASAGSGIEFLLTKTLPYASLTYTGGWDSWAAYVSYFLVFILFMYVSYYIDEMGQKGGKEKERPRK